MIQLNVRWNLKKALLKVARWVRCGDEQVREDVLRYGREWVVTAMRITPPNNGRMGAARAISLLKRRITRDFEGEGLTVGAGGKVRHKGFSEDGLIYRYGRDGRLHAFLVDDGGRRRSPSPFRVLRRRPGARALEALRAGGAEFVDDVGGWIRSRPEQYRMERRRGVRRLWWHGTRHFSTVAAVRREANARKARAGQLLAGWKAAAAKCAARIPAAVSRQPGRGTARLRRDRRHGCVLVVTNGRRCDPLQGIVDAAVPRLAGRLRRLAKRQGRLLAGKMRRVKG